MTTEDLALARSLRDRIEIERLVFLYGRALDGREEGDENLFDACMLEVEYPFGTWKGVAEHKRIHRATIRVLFTMTQHVISNPLIEIRGDTASAQYYVHAAHGIATEGGQKIVYGGAVYTHDLVRTDAGWRIRRHHCRPTWIDDEGGLLAACQAAFDAS